MANALYDHGRRAFLEGTVAYLTDDIKASLVTNSYTPDLATHQFVSDLGGNVLGTAVSLASKTSTAGVADAADVTFTNVPAGTVNYVTLYKETGTATTNPLIALIDTASGLPITVGSGGNITVTWDDGPNKIFKL